MNLSFYLFLPFRKKTFQYDHPVKRWATSFVPFWCRANASICNKKCNWCYIDVWFCLFNNLKVVGLFVPMSYFCKMYFENMTYILLYRSKQHAHWYNCTKKRTILKICWYLDNGLKLIWVNNLCENATLAHIIYYMLCT